MRNHKRLKGLTLMEIVISMAIYGVLALLIVEVMSLVNNTMRSTNQLNTRLSYESKFADNQITVGDADVVLTPTAKQITIDYGGTNNIVIPTSGASGIIGREYEANYQSGDANDMSQDIHYRYMVFSESVTPPGPVTDPLADWLANGDFMVYLDSDGFTDDILKVEVKSGAKSYVADLSSGKLQPTANGHLIEIAVQKQDTAVATNTGFGKVRIYLYRDMKAQTGGTVEQVKAADGVEYPSDMFPFDIADLTYTQWFRNALTNTVASTYDSATFTIESDGKIVSHESA